MKPEADGREQRRPTTSPRPPIPYSSSSAFLFEKSEHRHVCAKVKAACYSRLPPPFPPPSNNYTYCYASFWGSEARRAVGKSEVCPFLLQVQYFTWEARPSPFLFPDRSFCLTVSDASFPKKGPFLSFYAVFETFAGWTLVLIPGVIFWRGRVAIILG